MKASKATRAIVEVQLACAQQAPDTSALRRFAVAALGDRQTAVVLRIVGEIEGAALNERFRSKPGPTNVLSFPGPDDGSHLGDVIICAPVVAREAAEQGKTGEAHWAHMVVHGILHLMGYTHDADNDAAEMESLEVTILSQLGFPDPYGCGIV